MVEEDLDKLIERVERMGKMSRIQWVRDHPVAAANLLGRFATELRSDRFAKSDE